MAQRNPTAPQVVDPVESDINDTIDRLIKLLMYAELSCWI